LCGATLDADYCLEITGNNGTNLSVRVRLADSFSLIAGTIGQSGPEAGYKYYGVAIQPDEFENATARGEGTFDDAIIEKYLYFSKHDADDFSADGSWLKWYKYLPTVFQGIRLYSNVSFADGEIMFLKAGLPIAYTTPSGKLAETRLDKNYGFVYSASARTFTYICVVMFRDQGQVCAIREYLLTDTKPALPYAPDMDGYDDSWEEFKLVNGVVYVDAIHTPKQIHPVVKLTGMEVETSDDVKEDVAGDGQTSPITGDGANAVGYMAAFVAAMWLAVLTMKKCKNGNEE